MSAETKQWPRISLGELLRLERRPVKVLPDARYQEIGIYCFGRGIFSKDPRTGLEVGDKDLFLLKAGDFILQVTFAWEGAVAIVSPAEDGMYGSTRYPTFRVDESRCLPEFLLHYFKTEEGLQQLVRICPGSAGRNRVLNIKRIPEVMVPLPPIPVQQGVVELINGTAREIEEAKILRRDAMNEIDLLYRSILLTDKDPQKKPMAQLVRLRDPDVLVQAQEEYHFAGVYSFGRGVFRGQVKSGMEFAYPKLTRLRSGNFVYPKLMAWEGALGIVPPDCDGLVVSTEFPVFDVNLEMVSPEVLDVYFRDPTIWPALSGASTGTNVRRRRLNPADFLRYEFPVPSVAVQSQLGQLIAETRPLRALQADTNKEIDALLPSVIARAFTAQL